MVRRGGADNFRASNFRNDEKKIFSNEAKAVNLNTIFPSKSINSIELIRI
jgi:hypothetical protein